MFNIGWFNEHCAFVLSSFVSGILICSTSQLEHERSQTQRKSNTKYRNKNQFEHKISRPQIQRSSTSFLFDFTRVRLDFLYVRLGSCSNSNLSTNEVEPTYIKHKGMKSSKMPFSHKVHRASINAVGRTGIRTQRTRSNALDFHFVRFRCVCALCLWSTSYLFDSLWVRLPLRSTSLIFDLRSPVHGFEYSIIK